MQIGCHQVTLARWETGSRAPVGLVLAVVESWLASAEREVTRAA